MNATPTTTAAPTPDELVELIMHEGPISMTEASALLGPGPSGRLRRPGSVADYCVTGCRGVKLEGIHGPGGWITSRQAVARFLANLHAMAVGSPPVDVIGEQRKARQAATSAELKRLREDARESYRKRKKKTTKPKTTE